MSAAETFIARVEGRSTRVGVVGLGYVGLPVALSFVEAGFSVVGIDLDPDRVRGIENEHSFLKDVPDDRIASARRSGSLEVSSSYDGLAEVEAILICVPTPISDGAPDLSMVIAAGEGVGRSMQKDCLVVLESTTYPGTTEELLLPLLEQSGFKAGRDFLLAYSPERIDPGNPVHDFADIPKIVGGMDEASTRAAESLYGAVVPKVVTVSGTREAELAKLIENTFRHVNIALVNELAVYAHEMGLDIWQAIEAAGTKPFGFLPFWPGPGWGGHCIPLDPAYLSWKVRKQRAHDVRFVELAHTVNSEMPRYVTERVALLLNESRKPVNGAKVLGIGIAYKGGTEDTRGSAGMKVLDLLAARGADVSYHDPLVDQAVIGGIERASSELTEDVLRTQDLVIILIPQTGVRWDFIVESSERVFDCCNALAGLDRGNIVRL